MLHKRRIVFVCHRFSPKRPRNVLSSFSAAEGMVTQINYHRTWSGCKGLRATGKQMAVQRVKVNQVVLLDIYFGLFKPKIHSQILFDHSFFRRFFSFRTGFLASKRKAVPNRNIQLYTGHGGTSRTKQIFGGFLALKKS